MLIPAIGLVFLITGYLALAVSSLTTNTEHWKWPYSTYSPEVPINASTKIENNSAGRRSKSHHGISPEITVRVFAPLSQESQVRLPVKVHIETPQQHPPGELRKHPRRTLFPQNRGFEPPSDNFLSASSNMMQYDDIPKTFMNQNTIQSMTNDVRVPIEPQNTAQTPNGNKKPKKGGKKKNRKRKVKKSQQRSIFFTSRSASNRNYSSSKKAVAPVGFKQSWLTFHSSRRVFVPVRKKNNASDNTTGTNGRYCITCPTNFTLYSAQDTGVAIVPVPKLSICKKLARRRGKLNLAVINGPNPGTPVMEGIYPTTLIAWKFGGKLFSCQYTVTVKAEKCPEIKALNGLIVTCDMGNDIGSSCNFECPSPGYYLTSDVKSTKCTMSENGILEWTNSLPSCARQKLQPEVVSAPSHVKTCQVPTAPVNGKLICNSSPNGGMYPSGTICQFFCFPGFESRFNSSESLFVCGDGAWDPEIDLSCTATVHCPWLMKPKHGTVTCRSSDGEVLGNNGFHQGTRCSYKCDEGFVVPKSQSKLIHVECLSTKWNQTTTPECKRKVAPIPGPNECENRTLYFARGTSLPLKYPTFYSEDGSTKRKIENVTCSHGLGKLVPGTHINRCTAYDQELDMSGSCTYTVEVKAKSCPLPKEINHSRRKCTHDKKPITNGHYPPGTLCRITCEDGYMFSPELDKKIYARCLANSRWNRSWKLSCKKVKTSCPSLRAIPHGNVSCTTDATSKDYSVSSVCTYECEQNYVVPSDQLARVTRRCLANGKWNISQTPTCTEQTPPKPITGSCVDIDVEINELSSFTVPQQMFELFNGSQVIANCTHDDINSYGSLNVTCSSYDSELRISGNCSFIVNITPDEAGDSNTTNSTDTDIDEPPIITIGCSDQTIGSRNASDLTFPEFVDQQLNMTLNSSCSPSVDLDAVGIQQDILCMAVNSQSNKSSNCSFKVTVITDDEVDDVTDGMNLTSSTESTISNHTDTQDEAPQVVEPGCVDQFTESGYNFNVSLPEFVTMRNTSAEVVCSPVDPDLHEVQTVSCEASDPETNTSSSCEFKVTVANGNLRSHDVMEDITEALTRDIFSSLSQIIECEALEAPSNGRVDCSSPDECTVECDDGYGFSPSEYPLLSQGKVSCNKSNGLWDFQNEAEKIPDCLRELPSTSVEVWLGFSASVGNCSVLYELDDDIIRQKLFELNDETCQLINCNVSLVLNCSEDEEEESNNSTVVVTWNLKASYNPKDYKFNKKVPVAETQLESILEDTKKAIQSEDSKFSQDLSSMGLQVMRNTFARGHMNLVCDEKGFIVEPETDQCIECAAGKIEVAGSCVPCPSEHYQDESGQTECKPCPTASDEMPAGC